jgi:hypothetical protein
MLRKQPGREGGALELLECHAKCSHADLRSCYHHSPARPRDCHLQVTEEEDEPIFIEEPFRGDYAVVFDPLDGSSNIDCGVSGAEGGS